MGGGIGERVTRALNLPREAVLDAPALSMALGGALTIENHKGVLAYTPEEARVRVSSGAVRVKGAGLRLLWLTKEFVVIGGQIEMIVNEQ